MRTIIHWNNLPRDVMESPLHKIFKMWLERVWDDLPWAPFPTKGWTDDHFRSLPAQPVLSRPVKVCVRKPIVVAFERSVCWGQHLGDTADKLYGVTVLTGGCTTKTTLVFQVHFQVHVLTFQESSHSSTWDKTETSNDKYWRGEWLWILLVKRLTNTSKKHKTKMTVF